MSIHDEYAEQAIESMRRDLVAAHMAIRELWPVYKSMVDRYRDVELASVAGEGDEEKERDSIEVECAGLLGMFMSRMEELGMKVE